MVLYGITLVSLAKELRVADSGVLSLLSADDVVFNGSARQSAQLLNLLMERRTERGHFPEPANSIFISDTLGQEEAAKREFAAEGLVLNFGSVSRSYLGPQEEL